MRGGNKDQGRLKKGGIVLARPNALVDNWGITYKIKSIGKTATRKV